MIILDVVGALIIVGGLELVEVVVTRHYELKYHAPRMVKRKIVGGCVERLALMMHTVIRLRIHLMDHSDI